MDINTFKKTFTLICDECGEFAHTQMEYCENCGAQAIRNATNEDYTRYEMETISDLKNQEIGFEKAEETKMIRERAEKVSEKARIVAEKAEKTDENTEKVAEKARIVAEKAEKKVKKRAEKAKRRAEKTKDVAEKAENDASKARKRVKKTKEEAKTKAEKS